MFNADYCKISAAAVQKKTINTAVNEEMICKMKSVHIEVVYVEWASGVNCVTIFGDLYQNKLWVICNNLNQFAHLSSASGPSNDVIKMAAIVLLMYTESIWGSQIDKIDPDPITFVVIL